MTFRFFANFCILEDQCYPDIVSTNSVAEIKKILVDYMDPKTTKHFQRYHFHKQLKKTDQSVREYIKEIRKVGSWCEFADFNNKAMLDNLLVGMSDEQLVEELLQVAILTWKKAQMEAFSREQTNKEAQRTQLKSGGLVGTSSTQMLQG